MTSSFNRKYSARIYQEMMRDPFEECEVVEGGKEWGYRSVKKEYLNIIPCAYNIKFDMNVAVEVLWVLYHMHANPLLSKLFKHNFELFTWGSMNISNKCSDRSMKVFYLWLYYYLKCLFPMNPNFRLLVGRLVGWLVVW